MHSKFKGVAIFGACMGILLFFQTARKPVSAGAMIVSVASVGTPPASAPNPVITPVLLQCSNLQHRSRPAAGVPEIRSATSAHAATPTSSVLTAAVPNRPPSRS